MSRPQSPEPINSPSHIPGTVQSVYDIFHVLDPWFTNALIRVERFFYGYLLTYPWTGSDAKTPFSLLLSSPALFGFGLFITSFRFDSPRHVFVALWIASLVPTTLAIHFLPRYALPQVPGFLLACLMGYAFLFSTLLAHPRRRALLTVAGLGCALVLYGIKYQPPIATFEFTPPAGSVYPGVLVAGGICVLLALGFVYRRVSGEAVLSVGDTPAPSLARMPAAVRIALALLILMFGVRGYTLAAVAHFEKSPNQRLVEFVKANFDTNQITPCWDNQTHSTFEVLIPGTLPTGYWSAQDLVDAHDAGQSLLVTDRCHRWDEIEGAFALTEIGRFEGESPLWSKTPEVRLYAARRVP